MFVIIGTGCLSFVTCCFFPLLHCKHLSLPYSGTVRLFLLTTYPMFSQFSLSDFSAGGWKAVPTFLGYSRASWHSPNYKCVFSCPPCVRFWEAGPVRGPPYIRFYVGTIPIPTSLTPFLALIAFFCLLNRPESLILFSSNWRNEKQAISELILLPSVDKLTQFKKLTKNQRTPALMMVLCALDI